MINIKWIFDGKSFDLYDTIAIIFDKKFEHHLIGKIVKINDDSIEVLKYYKGDKTNSSNQGIVRIIRRDSIIEVFKITKYKRDERFKEVEVID